LRELTERSDVKLRDAVAKAKAATVANDDESAMEFLRKRSLNAAQAKKVLDLYEQEEGGKPRSAWDMAQGITAMARAIPHQDNRVTMERVAGKLLDKVAS